MQHKSAHSSTPKHSGLRATLTALACAALVSVGGVAVAANANEEPVTLSDTSDSTVVTNEETPAPVVEEPAVTNPEEGSDQESGETPVTPEEPAPVDPQEPATEGPLAPEPEAPATDDALEDQQSDSAKIGTLAVGPDGAQPPYVYWDTRNEAGNALQGGATYRLQGPRTSSSFLGWETNVSWNDAVIVTDCTAAPCSGPDLDPDPGEFLVKQILTHNISDSNRYRVQQVDPPSGFTWVNTANPWVEIPGSRNTPTGWSGRTYDFGDFKTRAIPPKSPVCTAGYVYGLQNSGQIRQVSPTGTVTNLGDPATGGSSFNGLGIGAGGSPVFAYARGGSGNSSSNVAIYQYNTTSGTWSWTGARVNSNDNSRTVGFVAGAVDLKTGKYYLGGFSGDGNSRVFRLWEYDPSVVISSSNPRYKGQVAATGSGDSNGDIALDANGNLFIVRGSGSTTTVYSVTAAELAAANGGTIPSSGSEPVTGTSNDVNGTAFDGDGRGYLSNGSNVERYNMPGWTNKQSQTSGLSTSTDLASCGSPPTITIEKKIDGGRVNNSDQFKLELRSGNTVLGSATTEGNAVGVQPQRIGPQPTVRNTPLSFTETSAGTTNLNQYVSSYQCFVDGESFSQGEGTSGSITIPSNGQEVLCQFTNAPLVASVTIQKQVTDEVGENPQPRSGWSVGSSATATTGSVVRLPNGDPQTKQTGTDGTASWRYQFGGRNDVANINVFEQMAANYQFQSASCEVLSLGGGMRHVEIAGPDSQAISGVKPGDQVYCGYVNRPVPKPTLTLVKSVSNPANGSGYAGVGDWTLTATGSGTASGTTVSGATAAPAVTKAVVPAGTYALSETFSGTPNKAAGYQWTDLVCTNANGNVVFSKTPASGAPITGASVTLASGDDVTCTYTNTSKIGSVVWKKVDNGGKALSGSEWKLTGPGVPTDTVVTDCVQAACATGLYKDQDPDPGKFLVKDLQAWGDYTLTESKAPAGYKLDTTTHDFTISYSNLNQVFETGFVNEPITPPDLPLTGGVGRDAFFIGGGVVLLLGLAGAATAQRRNSRKEVN